MGNKHNNLGCIFMFIALTIISVSNAQIISAQNGNWTNGTTWVGGMVPTPTDNVIISTGDTVIVNNGTPDCNNLSFADATAMLSLPNTNSKLSIYGNFTIASTSHQVFTSWVAGAKIAFRGGNTQTLSGWPNNLAPPFSFLDVEVNKTAGKVVTSGTGMRIGIRDSLVIKEGVFELAAGDDIEGRNLTGGTSGGPYMPMIKVENGGFLNMAGVNSHIRSGGNMGDNDSKIGKLVLYDTASFTSGQANRINFNDVDVESGGVLEIKSGGAVTGVMNLGKLTIKDGGYLKLSNITNNYWFTNATSPNELEVNANGEVEFNANNPDILPQIVTLQPGSWVRYPTTATTMSSDPKMDTLQNVRYIGNAKTFQQNTTVQGTLSMRTATGATPSLNLNGFNLTYGVNAILEYRGIGTPVPSQTTTNIEWPTSGSVPNNVNIYNSQGVTLNSAKSISGTLSFQGNIGIDAKLNLGNFDLAADTCTGYDSTKYVVTNGTGKLTLTNIGSFVKVLPIGNSKYNPLTINNGSNLSWSANVEDNISNVNPAGLFGAVLRTWNITPSTNPPPAGADITFQYNDADATQLGTSFDPNKLVQLWHYGNDWFAAGVTQTPTGTPSGIRTASITNWTAFSPFAISNFDVILPSIIKDFNGANFKDYNVINCNLTDTAGIRKIELEYSIDNSNFSKLFSFVSPQLNNQYKHVTGNNIGYYRAKIFGDAGQYVYSPIIKVKKSDQFTKPFKLQILHNTITITNLPTNKKLNYSIISLDGKKIMQGIAINNAQINTASVPKGLWYFVAENNAVSFIVR